jgi:hypothetical protein
MVNSFLIYFNKKEHKIEMDAREPAFKELEKSGNEMQLGNHPESGDIRDKLDELKQLKTSLANAWRAREIMLNQCLALVLFNRDCDTTEKWMTQRESSLLTADENVAGAGDGVEEAFRRHEDLDRAIRLHGEKIARVKETGEELIDYDHYDKGYVRQRLDNLLDRWNRLKQALLERRFLLDDSQLLEKFRLDVKEMDEWLDDKLEATKSIADETPRSDTGDILVFCRYCLNNSY